MVLRWMDGGSLIRDYTYINHYLDVLQEDIYPQPSDEGHTSWAKEAIDQLLPSDVESVLDIGCGSGFCRHFFEDRNLAWVGTTLNIQDAYYMAGADIPYQIMDMSFLQFPDASFDLLFARHTLEHSPMPLLTLKEWHRVSRKYSIVIVPTPEFWNLCERNHYFVIPKDNWICLFAKTGWQIEREGEFRSSHSFFQGIHKKDVPVEYRWLLRKTE